MKNVWIALALIFTAAGIAAAVLKMDDRLQCLCWNGATAMLWGYVASTN